MALTGSFNEFAGKVVSEKELLERLRQAGYTEAKAFDHGASFPKQDKFQRRIDVLLALDTSIHELFQVTYMDSKILDEIQEAALKESDAASAVEAVKSAITSHSSDVYTGEMEIGIEKVIYAYDDKKLTDDYIKVVRDCRDHRNDVGAALVDMHQNVQGIAIRIANKFFPKP